MCRLCVCCMCIFVILLFIGVLFAVGPLTKLRHHFIIKQSVHHFCDPNVHGFLCRRSGMTRKPLSGYTAPPP
ncbi:unnamed protein product [Prunus armeniaca]|uniref:Uncharacterized protein n=1 Tax=Prunus armeniaca TaxID=36596 RepID=A0A6J5XM88_PRUAR|nr:unnamed protein product [Prunus armeniaca]CAB4312228.1 unnamed protein product [Prunus armeniaca]